MNNNHKTEEFHYINPLYRVNINGKKQRTNKRLSKNTSGNYYMDDNYDSANSSSYDFAFRGNIELVVDYIYTPYYNNKKKEN